MKKPMLKHLNNFQKNDLQHLLLLLSPFFQGKS